MNASERVREGEELREMNSCNFIIIFSLTIFYG